MADNGGNSKNITLPESKNDENALDLGMQLNGIYNMDALIDADGNIRTSHVIGSITGTNNNIVDERDIRMSQDDMYTFNVRSHGRVSNILANFSNENTDEMDIELDHENGINNFDDIMDENIIRHDNISMDGSIERPRRDNSVYNENASDNISNNDTTSIHDRMSINSELKQRKDINIDIKDDDEDNEFGDDIVMTLQELNDNISIATHDIIIDNNKSIINDKENTAPIDGSVSPSKRKKYKKTKKIKFTSDNGIEFKNEEEQYIDFKDRHDREQYIYQSRDLYHIWREKPLIKLNFNELMTQPLSKHYFKRMAPHLKNMYQKQMKNVDAAYINSISKDIAVDVERGRHSVGNRDGNDSDNDINDINDDVNIENNKKNDDNMDDELKEMEVNDITINDDMDRMGLDDNIDFNISLHDNTFNEDFDLNNDALKPREWGKRTKKAFEIFRKEFNHNNNNEISFNNLSSQSTKKHTIAGLFYEMLVLKNAELIELNQNKPYDDIKITVMFVYISFHIFICIYPINIIY